MALIKCSECGKEISDKAITCPGCGFPVLHGNSNSNPDLKNKMPDTEKDMYADVKRISQKKTVVKRKNELSTVRLTIGIIMTVLSVIVLYTSCSVAAVQLNETNSWMVGILTFFVMLICGIVSITTRNTESYIAMFIMGGLLALYGFVLGYVYSGDYTIIFRFLGWILMFISILYFASAKAIKNNRKQ